MKVKDDVDDKREKEKDREYERDRERDKERDSSRRDSGRDRERRDSGMFSYCKLPRRRLFREPLRFCEWRLILVSQYALAGLEEEITGSLRYVGHVALVVECRISAL